MRATLQRHLSWLAWLLITGIFALDLQYPPGYAVSLLYIGVILLGLWTPNPNRAIWFALVSTAATLIGLPGATTRPVYFNRVSSIIVLWVTAVGVALYRRAALRASRHSADRLGAEAALRRTVKALEDVKYALDQSAIVATTNVRGDITSVNEKFCEISKYSREELLGQNHRILNSGLHPVEFFKEMYATIANGQVWRGEIRNRAKDGSLYWVDTTIVPFLDERQRPYQYIAIRYDITERKASEAALREQESLAQLGKMAAVVAHEVRNPLAGIRGALQVIGRRLPHGGREQDVVGEIISRIDTLNNIVQDLLQFARPRQPVLTEVPIDVLMQETISLLREDPKLAGLRIHVDAAGLSVAADAEQLKLAVHNLVMNSAQAMHGVGDVHATARRAGDRIELRIVDSGPGIPEDVRSRLFEPFFTTKHRGTGLGLATARRILESHHGTIELQCPPEGGTVAVLRLPAVPE